MAVLAFSSIYLEHPCIFLYVGLCQFQRGSSRPIYTVSHSVFGRAVCYRTWVLCALSDLLKVNFIAGFFDYYAF